jgi:hypothetical protein
VAEAEVACSRGGFTLCRPNECESVSPAIEQRPRGGTVGRFSKTRGPRLLRVRREGGTRRSRVGERRDVRALVDQRRRQCPLDVAAEPVPQFDRHQRVEPELLERLWSNTRRFKAELARLGFDIGRSETPITPVILGDSETTIEFSGRLFDEGVFATSVVYPTVALDRARIRTIVTAAHTEEHLDTALDAFARVGRELGLIAS